MDPVTAGLAMAAIGAGTGAALDKEKRGRGALLGGTLGGLGGYFGAPLLAAGAPASGSAAVMSPTGAILRPEVLGAAPAPSAAAAGGSRLSQLALGTGIASNVANVRQALAPPPPPAPPPFTRPPAYEYEPTALEMMRLSQLLNDPRLRRRFGG